ncbi:MAG TPA: cytosine permease [Solirubrobacteraceae bacterium]|nr:cytosine permease [Solirubrobacteraceae bacterium]HUA71988.1 cytosine permease [Solirubrobacteraceae bacterium]
MTTTTERTGQSSVLSTGSVEIRSIDYVPESERHGKPWHLGPVWFQGNAQLSTLAVGAIGVAAGLNLIWAMIAIILGTLIGTLFMAFHSAQGPKLGLPQMIQSRAQFGYFGSLLPVIVAVLLFIGFNVFNTILGGQVIQELFPSWGKFVAYLPVVILSLALTIFGYELIHTGLRWATWLFIVAYGVFTIGALFTIGAPHNAFDLGKFSGGIFLLQFGAVVSYQLTWAPYVSEYSRYLPRDTPSSTVFWWTYWGSAIGGIIPFLVGAFILSVATTAAPVAQVHDVANKIFSGFGPIIMICSLPGLIAVTAMNMYSGGLSTLTTVDTVKRIRPNFTARWTSVGFITVAGTVLALTLSSNFLTNFSAFLTMILYFMIPWTAVNLMDFFFVRKGNYAIRELFKPNGLYHAWGWRGLTAYAIGFVVMIPFMSIPTIYTSPIAKQLSGGDLSPFIGFPVAALAYLWLARDIDVAAETKIALEQHSLLEAEALKHEEIGEEPAFDVGARVADEFEDGTVERHPQV